MINQLLEKNIEQNLHDAGCDDHAIEKFLEYRKNASLEKQILFLKCQRCKLLDNLHLVQKKIDCLDYLIYMLKKEKGCDEK